MMLEIDLGEPSFHWSICAAGFSLCRRRVFLGEESPLTVQYKATVELTKRTSEKR